MDKAIKYHFNKDIITQEQLTGGYTFQTWLLTLSDRQKVVFRHQIDLNTGDGGKLNIADILERERFFYSNVNKAIGRICPEVYIVDGTREHHDNSYCIMEYIEGMPLNQCFGDFDAKTKNNVLCQIGEIAARINSMEIESQHPYIANRDPWEIYIADRLYKRFVPLISSSVITQAEAEKIASDMRDKRVSKTRSFLHLDMRRINMIYNSGKIYVLDAENSEYGDPLFELAVIDCGGELEQALIDSYKSIYSGNINIDDELYSYYKMERMALVLHIFMNLVKNDTTSTQKYMEVFNKLKQKLKA